MRTNIPKLAANFIDSFLPQYNSHHGEARINLIKEIKKAMDAAEPTWALTPKVIDTRLDNEMKKANKAAAAKAAAEVAEVDAATEAPTAAEVEPID